ncbi:MAG: hypothetical protein SFV17_05520 [Candidatus Obscuribacter sp.]|nr:hypothetical protein [Candidatus Obscuribacter sp.]
MKMTNPGTVKNFLAAIGEASASGLTNFLIAIRPSPDDVTAIEMRCLRKFKKRVSLIPWVRDETLVFINKFDDAVCEEIAFSSILQAFWNNRHNVQLEFCLPRLKWQSLQSRLSSHIGYPIPVQFINQDRQGTCLWITLTNEQVLQRTRGSSTGVADAGGLRWDAGSAEEAFYIRIGRHDLAPGCLPSVNS